MTDAMKTAGLSRGQFHLLVGERCYEGDPDAMAHAADMVLEDEPSAPVIEWTSDQVDK